MQESMKNRNEPRKPLNCLDLAKHFLLEREMVKVGLFVLFNIVKFSSAIEIDFVWAQPLGLVNDCV